MPLPFPEVMPTNPMVLYITNRVELELDKYFEILPHSY
jgi:hypothetical protein